MPAVVDHESRREHVARIAADIIARIGIEAVTMRQIAAEAGFSTTIVTHYFRNKQELLLHTYRVAAGNAQARVAATLQRDPCDLPGCLEALLPQDDASLRDWKVYLAFWHTAVLDPDFAAEQASQALNARRLLAGVLKARAQAGLRPHADEIDETAKRLLVIIVGVAVQSVFDPVMWSPDEQRRFLLAELGPLCERPDGVAGNSEGEAHDTTLDKYVECEPATSGEASN